MPSSTPSDPNRGGGCTAVTVASAPTCLVVRDDGVDRHVGEPVAVGQQEALVEEPGAGA